MNAKGFFKDLISNIVLLDTKEKNCDFRFFIESQDSSGYVDVDLIIDNYLAFTIKCKINFDDDEKPTLNITVRREITELTEKEIRVVNDAIVKIREVFDDMMHIYEG